MNLENYTHKNLVAVQHKTSGKIVFCYEANTEGVKAARAKLTEANTFNQNIEYTLTYFSAYIKTPHIEW